MRTTITNSIHFNDGLDVNFIRHFKKIFPEENYEVHLWNFELNHLKKGNYEMILTIEVKFEEGTPDKFVYEKTISNMTLIDSIKNNENESKASVAKRKCIIDMIGNDTFIEELDEFLTILENN